jgi:cytochrome c oxidase subunit 2
MYLHAKQLWRLVWLPVLFLFGVVSPAAFAESGRWQMNMPQGVTPVSQGIYDIHMQIFIICCVIGVGVFAYMFYSLIAYRRSKGHKPATFHDNTQVEILWTIIPFFILLIVAWPATTKLLEVYDTEDADIDVLITGYQWKWSYEYLLESGENVKFFSALQTSQDEIYGLSNKDENYLRDVDNPLVIPVGKKVRFLVTANDVIHSWWVPDLGVKKDAIPGFINETWARAEKEGVYRGQCAELCGKDHGFMPIVVKVTSEEEFASWIADQQAEAAQLSELMSQQFSLSELVERGEAVYQKSCLACHGANGEGGLGKAIAGSPIAMGDIKTHIDIGVNGVQGTAMQAFGGQLNDLDMAAVLTFQRNAFGNNMGDAVQAIDVYNFKKGEGE